MPIKVNEDDKQKTTDNNFNKFSKANDKSFVRTGKECSPELALKNLFEEFNKNQRWTMYD